MTTLPLLFSTATTLLPLASISSSSPSTSILPFVASDSFTRLDKKSLGLNQNLFDGTQIHTPFKLKKRCRVMVRALFDIEDAGPFLEPLSESEDEEEIVGIKELPLDVKLQLKLEKKLRMKLSKKIKIRGKKLVRRRQRRKKGRWPPSKMKKKKNV